MKVLNCAEKPTRIGIVDADLIGREKHRFPNLACEKISGYWKQKGAEVRLITSFDDIDEIEQQTTMFDVPKENFDKIYISKVFTDTPVPKWVDDLKFIEPDETSRVQIGGTGFYFDKAPNLPDEIEHHMPDYNLYDEWIASNVQQARESAEAQGKVFNKTSFMQQFKAYTDYSIGFLTRGCFRKCKFCVNQKYRNVFIHSALEEFYRENRKKICLLDDNIMGCGRWKELFEALRATGKPFKFVQGMDERILNEEKCEMLFTSNYDGDYTFAFDNIADYDLIQSKLELISKYRKPNAKIKFYVLVGFESTDAKDVENAFKRIELLMRYQCCPYIMRYQKNEAPWKASENRGIYVQLAMWANQVRIFKKMSFRQSCEAAQDRISTDGKMSASMRALADFEERYPQLAKRYFDLRFQDFQKHIQEEQSNEGT